MCGDHEWGRMGGRPCSYVCCPGERWKQHRALRAAPHAPGDACFGQGRLWLPPQHNSAPGQGLCSPRSNCYLLVPTENAAVHANEA